MTTDEISVAIAGIEAEERAVKDATAELPGFFLRQSEDDRRWESLVASPWLRNGHIWKDY